ncbi:hypothetical protein HBI81_001730 [Parastagonospora nodorum]|nr:hypothetical protein HBI74_202620 [Parastagonospora nodorum]KAH5432959.1 hypothetical protein HBI32_052350 [Parastagonospora nodorum]KAH5764556.1 hypothetical protein HBI17_040170 [Parastagonospora nodorum]KAH5990408.1 hypothetical protein HBI84_178070 [Parastagonospora nodorum]KAH6149375.1 hypothetical protein HBI68_186250 [Parastagonospora nodorum]
MMEICRRLRLRTDAPDEAIRLHGACTHISKSSHLFITISIHIYSRKKGGKGKKEALTPARTNLKHAVVALVVAVANHPAPVFERAFTDHGAHFLGEDDGGVLGQRGAGSEEGEEGGELELHFRKYCVLVL